MLEDRMSKQSEVEKEQDQSGRLSPGGTPGGLGLFLVGLVLFVVGGYLILNQVQVTSGYWQWWGGSTFGVTLIPLVIGIAVLFFDGKSVIGWILAIAGLAIIFAGIIVNINIYINHTTLFNFIVMLALFASGLGLMARALRSR
jgi:hypothetical protein